MIKLKVDLELYSYDDLDKESREKAFNKHLEFLYEYPSEYENNEGEMVYDDYSTYTEEELKKYVEDSININDYLFFENGTQADITHYTGEHKKSGTTELNYYGKIYKIK